MRATCSRPALPPRPLTSAIPLLPLVWRSVLPPRRVFWMSCSISFWISPKSRRRAFAWRFASRPSRCSICRRRHVPDDPVLDWYRRILSLLRAWLTRCCTRLRTTWRILPRHLTWMSPSAVPFAFRLMGLPRWLCARIMASFDTPREGALNFAGNLAPAPLALHENAFATKADPYISQLVAPVFPGCHAPVDAQVTVASGVFERAAAVASDLNAQLIATAATRPGRCLEIGAGRGTKTYVIDVPGQACRVRASAYRARYCTIASAIRISHACIRRV